MWSAMGGAIAVSLLCVFGLANAAFGLTAPETVAEARNISAFDVPGEADVSGVDAPVRLAYLPILAWGPLLAVVTLDYNRRRRRSET